MKLFSSYFLGFVLSLGMNLCFAGEDNLYITPPPGSAFVRIFNAQTDKAVTSVSLGRFKVNRIDPGQSSDFVFMDAATKTVQIDQHDLSVNLHDGNFHTFVYDGVGLKTIDSEPLTDKRKALVHLINLTNDTLDLKTLKGDIDIVKGVAAYGSGARAINPAKIAFSVYNGSKKLLETQEIYLDRGRSGSVFVYLSHDAPKYIWMEDKLSTEK